MPFNFTTAERGRIGFETIPDDTLRIGIKNYSANESVSKLFVSTKHKASKSGEPRVKVAFAYDLYNQAIQVTADAGGFSAKLTEGGSMSGTLPVSFRRAGLPVGDYKLVPGERNVFQLAR